jgi:hypothetical protein
MAWALKLSRFCSFFPSTAPSVAHPNPKFPSRAELRSSELSTERTKLGTHERKRISILRRW